MPVHRVEHVEVAAEVHIMGPAHPSLVTILLLLEHVELHLQVGVRALGLDLTQDIQQLQA